MSKSPWRRSTSRSRDGNPPELLLLASPSSRGGRRECRVQAAPMARLQQKSRRQSPQVQPEHPAFPARWFTAYTCSPRCAGLFCHRRLAKISSQDLIPASGDQDHTISLVRSPRSSCEATRPPHPASHARDDWPKRPSWWNQDGGMKAYFSEKRKRNFAALDRMLRSG